MRKAAVFLFIFLMLLMVSGPVQADFIQVYEGTIDDEFGVGENVDLNFGDSITVTMTWADSYADLFSFSFEAGTLSYTATSDLVTWGTTPANGADMFIQYEGEGYQMEFGTDYDFTVEYQADQADSFLFSSTNMVETAVPIPGAVWLFITGALGFAGYRRKIKA
jgi:hypothetical protein